MSRETGEDDDPAALGADNGQDNNAGKKIPPVGFVGGDSIGKSKEKAVQDNGGSGIKKDVGVSPTQRIEKGISAEKKSTHQCLSFFPADAAKSAPTPDRFCASQTMNDTSNNNDGRAIRESTEKKKKSGQRLSFFPAAKSVTDEIPLTGQVYNDESNVAIVSSSGVAVPPATHATATEASSADRAVHCEGNAVHPPETGHPGAYAGALGENYFRVPTFVASEGIDGADTTERRQNLLQQEENDYGNSLAGEGVIMEPAPYLLEATRVEDVEPALAVEVVKGRNRKNQIILSILLLLAVIGVVVGAVVGTRGEQTIGVTSSPTMAPSLSFLPGYTQNIINEDTQGQTPQSSALEWLREHSDYFTMPAWRKQQLFAMATLFYGTFQWTPNNWLHPSIKECLWEYSSCDDQGRLVALSLQGRRDNSGMELLHLQIAPEISLLSYLVDLSLGENALAGSLPSELGLMSSLEKLTAHENLLSGNLPTELSLLTSLSYISFGGNILSGQLPSELGLMTSLTLMDGFVNAFSGKLPSQLGLLTSLSSMALGENHLTGILPTELGLMTSLETLATYKNNFSGRLPRELGMLTSLSFLSFGENFMSGELPSELGLMTALTLLAGYGNAFSGEIPTELGLLTAVSYLNLAFAGLSGSLPTEIGLMTSLEGLHLQLISPPNSTTNNNFAGSLPTELGWLASLESMELSDIGLSGKVPSELGLLTSLTRLGLQENAFSGSVSSELAQLTALGFLSLSDTLLTGSIPSGMCEIAALTRLYVDCGEVSCDCSSCVCTPVD